MFSKVALLLTVVAVVVGAFMAGYAVHSSGVHCPTEDSCAYSYSHGIGSVIKVTPLWSSP